jgi:hypothetical protein
MMVQLAVVVSCSVAGTPLVRSLIAELKVEGRLVSVLRVLKQSAHSTGGVLRTLARVLDKGGKYR